MNAVLTILNLVVNLRTNVINNKVSILLTHCVRVSLSVCLCSMWYFKKKRDIISVHIINKLVFIIETHCVLYEVGTVFLYIIYIVFSLQYLS